MASWFKRDKDDDQVDSTESTIEVKASVIAAVEAGAELGADAMEPAPDNASGALDQALHERRTLVQLCLYAIDRARSPGVVERLEEGLAGIGVLALRPDGIRFDPTFHEAGGTVETTDETLDGVVAETEVVGFSDRGDVLRPPIVTVYSKAAK